MTVTSYDVSEGLKGAPPIARATTERGAHPPFVCDFEARVLLRRIKTAQTVVLVHSKTFMSNWQMWGEARGSDVAPCAGCGTPPGPRRPQIRIM